MTFDNGLTQPVGGAAFLATMFDEEFARAAGRIAAGLILAAGDNVGASPPNSALLQDMPAIDVENAWGLDATSYGNHEFDFGVARLLAHQARANFPFLATNIVDAVTGQAPPWVTPSAVFTVDGVKVGVIGAELEGTPELVSAGATAGLKFLDEGPRIKAESERLRALGVRVQIVVIHEGTARGQNPIGNAAGVAVGGPDHGHRRRAPGHDRRRDDRRSHAPHLEPDAGQHPDHRGHQRGHELLGAPAHGQGRRRRLGRRRDPRGEEPRRRTAGGRQGDRRQGERRDRRRSATR